MQRRDVRIFAKRWSRRFLREKSDFSKIQGRLKTFKEARNRLTRSRKRIGINTERLMVAMPQRAKRFSSHFHAGYNVLYSGPDKTPPDKMGEQDTVTRRTNFE